MSKGVFIEKWAIKSMTELETGVMYYEGSSLEELKEVVEANRLRDLKPWIPVSQEVPTLDLSKVLSPWDGIKFASRDSGVEADTHLVFWYDGRASSKVKEFRVQFKGLSEPLLEHEVSGEFPGIESGGEDSIDCKEALELSPETVIENSDTYIEFHVVSMKIVFTLMRFCEVMVNFLTASENGLEVLDEL